MKYINTSCHHIFIDDNKFEKFKGRADATKNFQSFARSSVTLTQENANTQEYRFTDDSDVKREFQSYLDDPKHWEVFSESLAGSLLAEQLESNAKIFSPLHARVFRDLAGGRVRVSECDRWMPHLQRWHGGRSRDFGDGARILLEHRLHDVDAVSDFDQSWKLLLLRNLQSTSC